MTASLLVFNAGSSSLKISLFTLDAVTGDPHPVAEAAIDGLESTGAQFYSRSVASTDRGTPSAVTLEVSDDAGLIRSVLDWAQRQCLASPIAAVAHRIVHGGPHLSDPVLLDKGIISALEQLTPLAPLHMPRDLHPVKVLAALYPQLPQIACFDTAFHRSMPLVEQQLGLPRGLAAEDHLYRYGFHGLSYEFIASELRRLDPVASAGRVVAAHLGSGASMCAMVDGRSVATTMGFSALDGLLMGTRCGNLDPGVVFYLLRCPGQSIDRVEHLLYHKSGLLGVSGGRSADMRRLLDDPDAQAQEAVALFIYRIRRELGAMVAAAGGLDALVFTGGIGEHASIIRAAVVADAEWLGLKLDEAANRRGDVRISAEDSHACIWRLATDENRVVACHCAKVLYEANLLRPVAGQSGTLC